MKSIAIAVDVMSGDHGCDTVVAGVLQAAAAAASTPLKFYLCGDKTKISARLKRSGVTVSDAADTFTIEHCPDVLRAHDRPGLAWKTRPGASIIRCITLQSEGKVQASLSAGDTGILLGAALFILGRQDNVCRPALAALLPTVQQHPVLVLDVGANLNCRAEHLVCFGRMGRAYMQRLFSIAAPTVALLNIGKEKSKGTGAIRAAAAELYKQYRDFAGFIEAGHVLAGDAHVVVCDGFAGNVLLKTCESFNQLTRSVFKNEERLYDTLKQRMSILNSENYGAVPMLGIKGCVLKAHGSSSKDAITHALLTAAAVVQQKVVVSGLV